jgi:hypothetical protein
MLVTRDGVNARVLAGAAFYLALAVVGGVAIARRVEAIRSAPQV